MTQAGYIYAIGAVGTGYVKIGSTTRAAAIRLKQLPRHLRSLLYCFAAWPCLYLSGIPLLAQSTAAGRIRSRTKSVLWRPHSTLGAAFFWSRAKRSPPMVIEPLPVRRLARALGVSTDYLLRMDVPDAELYATDEALVGA